MLLVPVFSGYYLLAGLAVPGRDAGGEWDMGVFDNIDVQLPSRLPGSLEALHIQSLCMRDFVHLLNALQDLLQHRNLPLYVRDWKYLNQQLLVKLDRGPERFAEIALMKPKSVDMENRSNIAIRG
ncbi:hypothetical protein N7465_010023 [Penicillium sp. CMV-2018d]|nr:hypothetical protein N7465_010023 [Penicillium sp. CMV-2018d]